ncbi:MAG TPA: YggS family pyridoxal phosphate-dependent enzyme [Mycobacteriales bacterium]|nr:YggS family pyridoxal phosphate-dependent enzyme [Mycobacteriales bacterium]
MAELQQGRRVELATNLERVQARIASAAAAAGRDPAELTLIAVTKTYPATDVVLLADLGVTDIGENRDQEAAAKHGAVGRPELRWHFIGQLQRRKCHSVVGYADVVHSVDRPELAAALGAAAVAAGRTVEALVQVSLDPPGTAGRGGAAPDQVLALAELVAATAGLRLAGLMAVAPPGVDPSPPYRRLAAVSAQVRAAFPAATMLSAGMSGDLEAAVANGATHLRVGTALLGGRTPVVG